MKWMLIFILLFIVSFSSTFFILTKRRDQTTTIVRQQESVREGESENLQIRQSPSPSPIPLATIPPQKTLINDYHVFQTFNNCGPAALSMVLSYYDIRVSQKILGDALRPYQHPTGDNDDKSVTLAELAEKAKEYNLIPYHRPAGNIEIIKRFIAEGFPVATRTWLKVNEDIGHYRVIKGYDNTKNMLLQDDSLQGKNLWYSYAEFESLWAPFNYEYLVLVPPDKQAVAESILGAHVDEKNAWTRALTNAETILASNPQDMYALFNRSIALFHLGRYQESVTVFESVELRLPSRTLWYQIEPIQAYALLGDDKRVFMLTTKILQNNNRAYTEAYILRGEMYEKMGDRISAKTEYEKAVFYNKNHNGAQEHLDSVRLD